VDKILVIVHTEADGGLGKAAFEAVGAAKSLGAAFDLGIIGADVAAATNLLAGCGAASFFAVSGAAFGQSRYATDAAAMVALVKAADAGMVIAPATSRLARVAAGAAQRLGGRADTQVTALEVKDGTPLATRWFYRQRMTGSLTRTGQKPWIITLAPGSFIPWQGAPGAATVTAVPVEAAARTEVVGIEAPSADQQTIRPDAEVLFVAGAGWTKKQADGAVKAQDASSLILGFLNACKASLGSSKSLVDLSGEGHSVLPFLTHLHQVGQTGATPRHPKGLATCCHGEEPHVVGWRFITERRAVNLDPNCGWARGKADVLYVADAFAVMKRVNELLTA